MAREVAKRGANAHLQRDLGELAALDAAGQADDDRKTDTSLAYRVNPACQGSGVEAQLADEVVRMVLLALQGLDQRGLRHERVALRIAAHADRIERVRKPRQDIEQVTGVAEGTRGDRGVATYDKRLVDVGSVQAIQDPPQVIGTAHHTRGKVRHDNKASGREAFGHRKRAVDAVLR